MKHKTLLIPAQAGIQCSTFAGTSGLKGAAQTVVKGFRACSFVAP